MRAMVPVARRFVLVVVFAGAAIAWSSGHTQAPAPARAYFPAKGAWERRDPASLGMDTAKLDEAIAFAVANESTRNPQIWLPTSR